MAKIFKEYSNLILFPKYLTFKILLTQRHRSHNDSTNITKIQSNLIYKSDICENIPKIKQTYQLTAL